MSNEVPVEEVASTSETEEPNITTNVEEVSDEESVVSSDEEVAEPEVAKHDVAAGEGAFNTWIFPLISDILKSSTKLPFISIA